MSQDFHGGVGQVAEGDINNYGININLSDKPEFRGLLKNQRDILWGLKAQCDELGIDSSATWRKVMAELGVSQIEQIAAEQYPQARTLFQDCIDTYHEAQRHELAEDNKRTLVGKVLALRKAKNAFNELGDFCLRQFGERRLKSLTHEQLVKVLNFLEDYETPVAVPADVPAPFTPSVLPLPLFLSLYRWHCVWLLLLGLLVGGLWMGL